MSIRDNKHQSEGVISLDKEGQRMPNLRLAINVQDLVWRPSLLQMGLSKLPVAF